MLDGLTTVNIDFIRLYRPQTNVVSRPVAGIGNGYSLVGHHEIMIPLLAAALVEECGPPRNSGAQRRAQLTRFDSDVTSEIPAV